MQKKPLTPRDKIVLVVVAAIFVTVVATFAVLLALNGPANYHSCGNDPCPFINRGP